ncbi:MULTISPECIES: NAD-dependent epimerase/dehydratase family protein [unclassified Oceanobacter]|uniref:NAD-dependent epimerase/dehydratase family protein n=1 Tax=unclassified Oceanobacter TaxID=2620260 RepID=UPI002733114F|nr:MULTISPECIES: NAD-dependent epimerase/dehydratase family protein [unclassified Oceanobacter]MDP2608869.1 GDP-mannose 4,6-dehydratase [Oceanobacter sp. 1_MG-2023]MDP2611889.1 GDP-mannose 4,6-dehydratase [Oceanobacter sp. 2_MG-2023]
MGSNLLRKINNNSVEITVIDNLKSGFEDNIKGQDIKFIKDDILLFDLSTLERQDEIYHLACPASPSHYQDDPINTLDVCYKGTQKILEYAYEYGSKVVVSSTSEVYGDPLESPQCENYNGNVSTLSVRACYDEGKRVAETLCFEYHRKGVDVRIARLFNTYGPHMAENDGRVISNFICQALKDNPLTIYGSGEQTRSFCYVDDTIRGLEELMILESSDFVFVNIGNNNEVTVNFVAEIISELTERDCNFKDYPLPDGDPKVRKPDLSKAKKVIGWEPKISFYKGLKLTIDYFKKNT